MKLRHFGKGILLLPLVLLVLGILFELVGMAVNHAASARQTSQVIERLKAELPLLEIIDDCTKTGNTSGTGNHVDMLTVISFQTEADVSEIEDLIDRYYGLDEWYCWVKGMEEIAASREQYPDAFSYLEELELPEELEGGYLLYINTSAPFPDNIEGH